MILRATFCTVVMILAYGIYVHFAKPKPVSQHQFQTNVIRAQDFIYTDSLRKMDILLGTSISDKLRQDSLPKGVLKLTFPGQSVHEGLSLFEQDNVHPKFVFIEENSILSPERPEFSKYLFSLPNYYRKKNFAFMRDCYQPVGQIYDFIFPHSYTRIGQFTRHLFNPFVSVFPAGNVDLTSKETYYSQAKKNRDVIDSADVVRAFTALKPRVDALIKSGSKVYFYEVPNAMDVYNSVLALYIRKQYTVYFPASKYNFLPNSKITDYHSDDHIHLDDTSAKHFTLALAKKINDVRK